MIRDCLRGNQRVVLAAVVSLLLGTPAAGQAGTSHSNQPGGQVGPPGPVNQPSPPPTPRVEVFGGYAFLPPPNHPSPMEAGHGFAFALDVNLAPHFGLRADFDVSFLGRRPERAPDVFGGYELTREDITLSYYSVGPRFVHRWKSVSVFGAVLLEAQRSRWGGYSQVAPGATAGAGDAPCLAGGRPSPVAPCAVPGHTSGAWGFGISGGLDARIRERVAIRVLQYDYFLGGFGSGPKKRLRLKTGITFSFL